MNLFTRYKSISVIAVFGSILSIVYLFTNYIPLLGLLGVLIGAIFPALKYRLDSYHYNRELFSKRLMLFEKLQNLVNEIHCNYRSKNKLDAFLREFDVEIFNEGQFYFKINTVKFLEEFRSKLIDLYNDSKYKNNRDTIDEFFGSLKIRGY
ncbi:TPA: hypothetical protein JBJ46_14900 [Legionella pneumophila]|nr:hypothetical protein [Legionella pneumophila]